MIESNGCFTYTKQKKGGGVMFAVWRRRRAASRASTPNHASIRKVESLSRQRFEIRTFRASKRGTRSILELVVGHTL